MTWIQTLGAGNSLSSPALVVSENNIARELWNMFIIFKGCSLVISSLWSWIGLKKLLKSRKGLCSDNTTARVPLSCVSQPSSTQGADSEQQSSCSFPLSASYAVDEQFCSNFFLLDPSLTPWNQYYQSPTLWL